MMSIQNIIALGFVTGVIFILVVIVAVLKNYVVAGKLEKLANNIAEFLDFSQRRLEKIRPYIVSYFNTLHQENNNATEIMNQIMYSLEQRIRNADIALQKGSSRDQKMALQELTAPITIILDRKLDLLGNDPNEEISEQQVIDFNELEDVVESLFQSIGKDIANASKSMSAYRGERNRRKDTIFALMEAGIKDVGKEINKNIK